MRIPQIFSFLFLWLCLAIYPRVNAQSYPFEENKGQWDNRVLSRASLPGAYLFLENNAFHYQFIQFPEHQHGGEVHEEDDQIIGHNFRAEFLGANPSPALKKTLPGSEYYNYFLGNDKSKWASEVHKFREVVIEELYKGIDLKLYESGGFIKYDYILKPGTNAEKIQIRYRGVNTPKIIDGQIQVEHRLGHLIEEKPYAYQEIDGQKKEVACHFIKNDKDHFSFAFPEGFDERYELIIDPVLIFSTYSGSSRGNFGMTATYDDAGNGYMGGVIFSTGYDTTLGAFQRSFNGGISDVAISKFSPDGTNLLFSTYLGGDSCETVHSMVVDKNENLIIFGVSNSTNYPVLSNAYDTTKDSSRTINLSHLSEIFQGGPDIVLTKFNSQGTSLLGSTFYGGNEADGLNIDLANINSSNIGLIYNYGDQFRGEVIVDDVGNIYLGTSTYSKNLGFGNDTLSGGQDGIVAKFNPDLSSLIWSRYVGGIENDAIYSLKIINGNRVLVGGGTISMATFPTTIGSYKSAYGPVASNRADGFISILAADGSAIEKSTLIGTDQYDQIYFIEFDRFGGIYALGQTLGNFPLKNSNIYDTLAGQFIIKLDNNLDSLIYSTTFGDGAVTGAINISPTAFLVDQCQNVYVSGWGGNLRPSTFEGQKTLSNNMPITSNAFTSTTSNVDFYLYVMERNADSLLYATFFGGSSSDDHVDGGTSRFDKRGIIYQSVCASCGTGNFSDFPTTPNSYAPNKQIIGTGNSCNNALFKFDFEILPRAKIYTNKEVVCAPSTVIIRDSSTNAEELLWDFYGNASRSQNLDTTIYFDQPGFYRIRQYARDTICNSIDSTEIIIEVQPSTITYDRIPDVFTCDTARVDLIALTDTTASQFHWSSNPQFSDTLNPISDSIFQVRPTAAGQDIYLRLSNPGSICEVIDTINVRYLPLLATSSVQKDTLCEDLAVQFNSSFVNAQKFKWDFGNGQLDSTNRNPSVIYNNPGDYTITVSISNDLCMGTDTNILQLNVQANNLFIEPIPDSIYCGTDTLLFKINSAGTADDFLWSSNPAYSDTLNSALTDSTIRIFNNTNQNYYKKVSDRYCIEEATVNIRYIRYRVELDEIPDSACAPFDLQLNSTQEGITSFLFEFGNGQSNSSNEDPLTNYSDSGTYILKLFTNNSFCQRSDSLVDTIRIEPAVQVLDLTDTSICLGDTINLRGNSLGTANRFIWSLNPNFSSPLNLISDSLVTISPDAPGANYYFKASRTICADSTEVRVDVEEVDVFLDDLISICLGDTISLQAINNGVTPLSYFWTPTDSIITGQGSNSILVSPNTSLSYFLRSNSSIGCEDFDTLEIEVNQPAFSDAEILTLLDTLYQGQQVQLSTNRNGANLSYFWEPATGLSDPGSPNPIANPGQTTLYKVEITDQNTGCVVTAYRLIYVFEINCGEPNIFIPSAFTPNDDGNNDILYVRGNNIQSIDLQIFNRWGELVFQSDNPSNGWDGTFKGKKADPGVFVYQLKATCFDGQDFYKKGNITLIQ